jgi:hypothetical protein
MNISCVQASYSEQMNVIDSTATVSNTMTVLVYSEQHLLCVLLLLLLLLVLAAAASVATLT